MFARQAADFSTNHQLPSLDFAMNHYGQPDVAMFDFTCMYASESAAMIRQRHGSQLLVALVGDSLLEVSSSHLTQRVECVQDLLDLSRVPIWSREAEWVGSN